MPDPIRYEVENGVATITLDRPETKNALTPARWRELAGLVEQGADDARVIELTGAGDVFCAGDDIGSLAAVEDAGDVREITSALLSCLNAVERVRAPVVGNPGGSAYGGGFELLLATDVAVVPADATYALPEVGIGAFPFYAAKRLARLVGRQRAMDLALAGREISGATAAEWGCVARAVPSAAVDETVAALVADLQRGSPAAIETTKGWLNASLRLPGEDEAMRAGLGYLFAGPDASEGAEAFLEGREPAFRGGGESR